jgi:hypothetical protein
MPRDASELAHRLARDAETVCRHYLSNGRREGRYWLVGDVHNTPGRSMFVRLQDSPKGPAGKWTDAATGEYGDLLDIIRESLRLRDFREVAEEARRFLKLPRFDPQLISKPARPVVQAGSQEAARRLFAISGPIEGTVVEAYLHEVSSRQMCRHHSAENFTQHSFALPLHDPDLQHLGLCFGRPRRRLSDHADAREHAAAFSMQQLVSRLARAVRPTAPQGS